MEQTRQSARAAGQDPDAPPRDQLEEDFYTPDETCRRVRDHERIRMAAAGKYGDYFETNPFGSTFTPEASADLSHRCGAHRCGTVSRGGVHTPGNRNAFVGRLLRAPFHTV